MQDRSRRFLLDATTARCGGSFTYIAGLVPQLARVAPEHRFRLLLRSPRLAAAMPPIPNLEIDLLPDVGLTGRFRFLTRDLPALAESWGADLYYSMAESTPLQLHCPMIASCQNLNVFEIRGDWELYQQFRLRMLRGLAQVSAWRCDRIHFVSHDSAKHMGDRLHLPERRRAIIHHGIDLSRWAPRGEAPPFERPYMLSVSSVVRYKNFARLIHAYAELVRRRVDSPDLVIIGDQQDPEHLWEMEEARRAAGPIGSRVHIFGEVPYEDIHRYYAGASLFVFPSYLESFGLPLLEAMASDVPLVASDLPVFREIAGDAAFYADPHDTLSLADAMEEALFAEGASDMLMKRGRERVREFTWQRSASQLLALFHSVLAERSQREPEPVRPVLDWRRPAPPAPGLPIAARVGGDGS